MQVADIVSTCLTNYTIDQAIIDMSIAEVTQTVLNYCDLDVLPEQLNFTVANMSVDLIKYRYESTRDISNMDITDAIDPASVTMVKEGDTTIQIGSGGNSSGRAKALKSHSGNLDGLIMNYKDQLQKFRSLY